MADSLPAPGRVLASVGATLVLAIASAALAQDSRALSAHEAYGRGVSAYFNGNATSADAYLSYVLEANPRDVRAYYYRGLARLRMGLRDAAYDDFRVGAAIETTLSGRPVDIGRALERVQGGERLLIERVRREARTSQVDWRDSGHVQNARLDQRRQERVLRSGFRLPMEALAVAGSADELMQFAQTEATPAPDPFVDDPGQTAGVGVPEAARGSMTIEGLGGVLGRMMSRATGVTPESLQQTFAQPGGLAAPQGAPADAFGGQPMPGAGPGAPGVGENPFAGDQDNPFGAATGDPFGAGADEGGDPFGGEPPFSSPGEGGENPFGNPEENPFGDP